MLCQICKQVKLTSKNRHTIIVNDLDLMQERKRIMDKTGCKPDETGISIEQIYLVCDKCKAETTHLKPNQGKITGSNLEISAIEESK